MVEKEKKVEVHKKCPFTKEPRSWCSQCMAYKVDTMQWKETTLRKTTLGTMEEIETGNIVEGTIAMCNMGIYGREILNQKVIWEAPKDDKDEKKEV